MRELIFIILFCPFTFVMGILSIISMLISGKKEIGFSFAKRWSKVLIKLAGIKVKVKGRENIIGGDETVIFISNHQSLFDIPLLYANTQKPFIIMAKKSLFQIPIFGWHLSLAGNIAIDRKDPLASAESLFKALQKAKMNYSILLFPEGTRSHNGKLLPFKKGAFIIAKRVKKPIIPLVIKGTKNILPKGKIYLKKGTAELEFMPSLQVDKINNYSVDELSNYIWQLMNERIETVS